MDEYPHIKGDLAQCGECGAHFQIDPRGDIQTGPCPECGGTRMFMEQPSPVQSDGTLRNMVDSDTQKDAGGNPLKEGTIMGEDGERSLDHRDNYMHGHVISALMECGHNDQYIGADGSIMCGECGEKVGEGLRPPRHREPEDDPFSGMSPAERTFHEKADHEEKMASNPAYRQAWERDYGQGAGFDAVADLERHFNQPAVQHPLGPHTGASEACPVCGMETYEFAHNKECPWCAVNQVPQSAGGVPGQPHPEIWRTPSPFQPEKKPNLVRRMFEANLEERPDLFGEGDPIDALMWGDNQLNDERFYDHMDAYYRRKEQEGKAKHQQYMQDMYEKHAPPQTEATHPDPWMDNEPGTMTFPEHWAAMRITSGVCPDCGKSTSVFPSGTTVCNSYLCGKAWGPDGKLIDQKAKPATEPPGPVKAVTPYLDLDRTSGSVMNRMTDFERHSRSMEPYESLWEHDGAFLAPLAEAALPALGEAAGGEAAGGASGMMSVPGVGGLMKGVMGGGGGQQQQQQGAGEPGEMHVGSVLDAFFGHYETPTSNPDVGTKHDDPEEVDQKEFNDSDKSPKNIKNPETGEPGGATLGEKGHNKNDESMSMDSFADDGPATERLQMLLPLLLHFFNSEESGANDPMIKGLHEMLEAEHPGYLDEGDPHHAEILIHSLGQKHGVVENPGMAGEAPEMVGGGNPEAKPFASQPPGGMAESGAGTCPTCGGATDGIGGCPQCGTGQGNQQVQQMSPMPGGSAFAQQPMMNQSPQSQQRAANHQGPTTPEQIAVVTQWLIEHGRQEEAPNVALDPGNPEYVKILAEITGRANVAPTVQPQEVTPPPPPPAPGGSMPVPGMGAGEAGGQPMSPISSVQDFPDDALFFDKIAGQWGDSYEAPMRPSIFDEKAGLGAPQPQQEERYITAPDGRIIDTWEHNNVSAPQALNQDDQWWQGHDLWAGRTAADNVAERCPQCGSATTGMVGDDKGTQHCHACGNTWTRSGEIDDNALGGSTISHTAAPVVDSPNPIDAPAAEQASPLDIQPNEDSGLTWKDESGQPIEAGQTYLMKSTQYPVPDMVKVMRVKPDGLEVNEIGTFGNEPNALHHTIHVTREEMQANELTFQLAPQNADDRNAEPPPGPQAPGMPPVQETTDERANAYPGFQSSVREPEDDGKCTKCGHADGDLTSKGHRISHSDTMISEDQVEHECSYCGNNWITKEEMVDGLHAIAGEDGRDWVNPAAEWIREDDDSWSDTDRMRMMMASRSSQSRNISDIPRDRHAQEVKEYLDSQPSIVKEGGRYYSPLEQRGLIEEDGIARNSDLMNLEGTHYKHSREDSTVDPDRVPLEHILFGL